MKQILLRKDYIAKTVPPRQAVGLYLDNAVVKTWNEDFIDEDNQETVSIERNEVLYEKNTEVTDKVARDIEEYGISEVNVTNIPTVPKNSSSSPVSFTSRSLFIMPMASLPWLSCALILSVLPWILLLIMPKVLKWNYSLRSLGKYVSQQ